MDGLEVVKAYNGLQKLNAISIHLQAHGIECCRLQREVLSLSTTTSHVETKLNQHSTKIIDILHKMLSNQLYDSSCAGSSGYTFNSLKDVLSVIRELVMLLLSTEGKILVIVDPLIFFWYELKCNLLCLLSVFFLSSKQKGGLCISKKIVIWCLNQMKAIRSTSILKNGGSGTNNGGLYIKKNKLYDYYINSQLLKNINKLITINKEFSILIPMELSIDELYNVHHGNMTPSMVFCDTNRKKRITLLRMYCIQSVDENEEESNNERKETDDDVVTIDQVLIDAGDTNSPARKNGPSVAGVSQASSSVLRRAYRLADLLNIDRAVVNECVKKERILKKQLKLKQIKLNQKLNQSYISDEEEEDDEQEEEEEINSKNITTTTIQAAERVVTCRNDEINECLNSWKNRSLNERLMKLSKLNVEEEEEVDPTLTMSNLFPSLYVESTHVVTKKESIRLSKMITCATNSYRGKDDEEEQEEQQETFHNAITSLKHRECKQIALNILSEKLATMLGTKKSMENDYEDGDEDDDSELIVTVNGIEEMYISLLSKTIRSQPYIDLELSLGYMLSIHEQKNAFTIYRKELPKLNQMIKKSNSSNGDGRTILLNNESFNRYIVLFLLGERIGTIWKQNNLKEQCIIMKSNMKW